MKPPHALHAIERAERERQTAKALAVLERAVELDELSGEAAAEMARRLEQQDEQLRYEAAWQTLAERRGQEVFAIAPPRRQWLLEEPGLNVEGERSTGILPLGKVAMLAAAGGAGKTMAAVQLALAVATGREWLDTYTTPNPGHVLLVLGEEDAQEVDRRLYNAGRVMRLTDAQRQLALERIVVLPMEGEQLALIDDEGAPTMFMSWLRERLKQSGHDWRLIVLDPMSRFAHADAEKDNAAATRFIAATETLLGAPGRPTVLLAHHTNKTARADDGNAKSANAVRGASALTDGARWLANLDPHRTQPELVQLVFSKSNYSPRGRPIMLMREDGGALRTETRSEREQREQREAEAAEKPATEKANKGSRKGGAE